MSTAGTGAVTAESCSRFSVTGYVGVLGSRGSDLAHLRVLPYLVVGGDSGNIMHWPTAGFSMASLPPPMRRLLSGCCLVSRPRTAVPSTDPSVCNPRELTQGEVLGSVLPPPELVQCECAGYVTKQACAHMLVRGPDVSKASICHLAPAPSQAQTA